MYIPGWGIRWADFEAAHISVEMLLEAEPTWRGGRPIKVGWTDSEGLKHSVCYAEGLLWERTFRADEGGI